MYVLGKRDELKKLGLGVGNDLTAFQRKELQELREKGKRGFCRNGRLRIDETPFTRVTLPRRQDKPWRKSTVQQHQHPPSPSRDNLEPNALQQRESPAQPHPHRELAKAAVTARCHLSSSSRPTCREDIPSEVAPDTGRQQGSLPGLQQEKPPPDPSSSQAPPTQTASTAPVQRGGETRAPVDSHSAATRG
ncbi:hypothetical protein ElyMa_001761500 [Elysia marginata]|uniref:Uncharacterized protein n=1 Tax=Elysia marginata TaxID=1093978 RepID=A0AAV4EB15_9GAST|nr:hypothetical protein ElyMa_001761500 [Elysia marginata]